MPGREADIGLVDDVEGGLSANPADAVDGEEQVERARRHAEAHLAGVAKDAADEVARGLRPLDLRRQEGVALVERRDGAALHELRDAGGRILDQVLEHLLQRGMDASASRSRQPVIAQFLEKVLTNRMRSSGVHDVEEGRRAAAAVVEQRIDLVGDDPQVVPAREVEDRLQRLACRRSSRSGWTAC